MRLHERVDEHFYTGDIMIARVHGTKDFVDLKLYNFVLKKIKHHGGLYNFHEIETPILEPIELFEPLRGANSGGISHEMYTLTTAHGTALCLRPEAMPSIIRAYRDNGVTSSPWKVYMHGPMFPYGHPQHYVNQFSMAMINVNALAQDAHFLKMLDTLFHDVFTLENYVLKINFLGCLADRARYLDALKSFFANHKHAVCSSCQIHVEKNVTRIFDCSNEVCRQLCAQAPKTIDFLCSACESEWSSLKYFLAVLSINHMIDPMLMSRSEHCHHTIFEFIAQERDAKDTFCWGGHYSLGFSPEDTKDISSLGASIDMRRLIALIEKKLNNLPLEQEPVLHAIIPVTEQQRPLALLIAYELQAHGYATEVLVESDPLTTMMKKTQTLGARYVLMVGPDEQHQGTITIKDMQKGEQITLRQAEIVTFLRH
jgi:histidyl-tRNA synthetase